MVHLPLKIALAGVGKIARDQHVPALQASADWTLAATISRNAHLPGLEAFANIETFLTARPDIGVVSLCQPPQPRFEMACAALQAGRHVMLEKPPGATLSELRVLREMAEARGLSLFASWHSRMAGAVTAARQWLAGLQILSARVVWREDVRHWHPGQDWVFEPGGMGVFDPGINALSILTEILPMPLRLCEAEFDMPANRAQPIAARLRFAEDVTADFDWRQAGAQSWDIVVQTEVGEMWLRDGGSRLEIDGHAIADAAAAQGEYQALYARMADLVRTGCSDVDARPLELVADAFLLARRNTVAAFDF